VSAESVTVDLTSFEQVAPWRLRFTRLSKCGGKPQLSPKYAVSKDGLKMFGVLDLEPLLIPGCRFASGIRNSHDKSMRLGLTIGARVLVCMKMAFPGGFQPLLAKHSKSFSLVDAISVGVDRMQRNFEPMRRQVETWQARQLTSATAKLVICRRSLRELDAPKHLARPVRELCSAPQHEDFQRLTMWSLSNVSTSAIKELDPIPQFKATAKHGSYLERVFCAC
jgi:hypothetical protein